jgi:hypothetical protein
VGTVGRKAYIKNPRLDVGKSDSSRHEIYMHDVSAKNCDSVCNCAITCIRDDAARTFACALATTQFLCSELRKICANGARVKDLCLYSCRKIQNPERVDRVLP